MSQPPNFFFDRVIDTLRPFCFGRHHRSTTTVLRILTVVGDQNPRDGSDPPLILQAKQNSFFGAGGWPFFLVMLAIAQQYNDSQAGVNVRCTGGEECRVWTRASGGVEQSNSPSPSRMHICPTVLESHSTCMSWLFGVHAGFLISDRPGLACLLFGPAHTVVL